MRRDGPSSELPPSHWCLFARCVSQRDHFSLDDDVFSSGPFDRTRVHFGPASLRAPGLLAAASLAHRPDQYAETAETALDLLPYVAREDDETTGQVGDAHRELRIR